MAPSSEERKEKAGLMPPLEISIFRGPSFLDSKGGSWRSHNNESDSDGGERESGAKVGRGIGSEEVDGEDEGSDGINSRGEVEEG